MTGRLTWLNATSENFPCLDALDCWLGIFHQEVPSGMLEQDSNLPLDYLADQQVATAVLERDSDGNLQWQVSVVVAGGPGAQDLVDLGSFSSLVAAQAAAEQHLSLR